MSERVKKRVIVRLHWSKCVKNKVFFSNFAAEMFTEAQHLFSLAAAAYLVASLVAAAVRWFHMCAPYDKDPDYYYPGRPYVLVALLASLVLVPYILNPFSRDAWELTRIFCLPVLLYFFGVLMFGYFGHMMNLERWKWSAAIAGLPAHLSLLAGIVFIFIPGDQAADPAFARIATLVIYACGGLMTLFCLFSIRIVYKWIKEYDSDEYSNAEDLPLTFAKKMILLLSLAVVLLWTASAFNSQLFMAILHLVLVVLVVMLTILTLPPQRKGAVNPAPKEEVEVSKQVYVRQIPESRVLEILSAIAEVVLEREAFLNPHLTIQDVADRCGYNRTYVAGVFKSELGGFFNYINNQRLDYAEKYIKEHPKASIQEVAIESGFSSRQTYYSVKAKLRGDQ